MYNPILTTTNSKLDARVKEPLGVVPPPSGVGSTLDRFSSYFLQTLFKQTNCSIFKSKLTTKKFTNPYNLAQLPQC